MKEIVFRGRKKSGEWVYGDLIQLHEEAPYWYILPEGISSEMYEDEPYPFRQNDVMCSVALAKVIPKTIGQFTGLTDKNGKKIFEGDIVTGRFLHSLPINSVISFRNGAFGLLWDRGGAETFDAFTSLCNIEYEVIGNIHDNPELLGE